MEERVERAVGNEPQSFRGAFRGSRGTGRGRGFRGRGRGRAGINSFGGPRNQGTKTFFNNQYKAGYSNVQPKSGWNEAKKGLPKFKQNAGWGSVDNINKLAKNVNVKKIVKWGSLGNIAGTGKNNKKHTGNKQTVLANLTRVNADHFTGNNVVAAKPKFFNAPGTVLPGYEAVKKGKRHTLNNLQNVYYHGEFLTPPQAKAADVLYKYRENVPSRDCTLNGLNPDLRQYVGLNIVLKKNGKLKTVGFLALSPDTLYDPSWLADCYSPRLGGLNPFGVGKQPGDGVKEGQLVGGMDYFKKHLAKKI